MTVKLPELVPIASSRSTFAETDLMQNKEKMNVYADTASNTKPHSFKVGDTFLVRQKHSQVNKYVKTSLHQDQSW